ncbi:chymotrypsin-like elastase family member 1 [Haliotis rufescens]|uniref:chymotrypsin-like elastase family member 1 n=1 Tax=Haliotis rufescens TaxID=6454 RepID=UPI00201F53D1|nr:chymotrypsin-like elastase family member 1 [Haliotis rufescens]
MKVFLICCYFVFLAAAGRVRRLIGGGDAQPGSWPWLGSLQKQLSGSFIHLCSVSIMNDNWALTAGHCVDNTSFPLSGYKLRFGVKNPTATSPDQQDVGISNIIIHPQWSRRGYGEPNDLALLNFDQTLTFNEGTQPALFNISTSSTTPPESDINDCYLAGWGAEKDVNWTVPDSLQQASTRVIPLADCHKFLSSIQPQQLCAINTDSPNTICHGDSGGSLVCRHDEKYVVVGVLSWSTLHCPVTMPTVCTKLSSFSDWINSNVAG